MNRILPHPLVSAGLFLLWLLLNQTMAPGPALVGLVVSLLAGRALSALHPPRLRLGRSGLHRLVMSLRLLGRVLVDVAQSNLAVARVILGRRPDRRAGFVRIPLTLRDPTALAVLACILTATPGSAWIDHDAETGLLLLHVLDLGEEAAWAALVKDRYEKPLMEIFQ